MKEVSIIKAEDYDALNDRVTCINRFEGVNLNFVVKLSYKTKDGTRRWFQSEYKYPSKYIDKGSSYTLKRNMDYYWVVEWKKYDVFIMIRSANVILLREVMKQIAKIMVDDNTFWSIRDGRYKCKYNGAPLMVGGLPGQKWLSFMPVSYTCYQDEMYDKGVRICFGDEDINCTISVEEFMDFYNCITETPMALYAAQQLNYINWNDYGSSLVTFSDDDNNDTTTIEEHKNVIKQRKKSFFDD